MPIPSTTTSSPPPNATGFKIRLLPLGDDISNGDIGDWWENGYRDHLHQYLEPGNTVNFIGSLKGGSMADKDHEGHNGATIDQISKFAKNKAALPAKPNVSFSRQTHFLNSNNILF